MKDRAKYILPIVLILLIGLGIFAWIKTDSLSDFGLNFATEIIGVLITIYIVDYLLNSREKARLAPMRVIVFQEVSVLFNRHIGMYFELYSESVKEEPPATTKRFIEKNCIYKALLYSTIDGKPRISPPQTMTQYLASKAVDFENRAEKILDKYSNYMFPEIANLLHQMYVESPFISVMKILPNIVQSRLHLPYPKSLVFHLSNPDEKYKTNMIKLNSWLVNERKELLKIDSDLRTITNPEYLKNRNDKHQFIYRLEKKDLEEQIKKFDEWKITSANNV